MEIYFDPKKNRVIVEISEEQKYEIPPQSIRDILPTKDEAQKLDDLNMILHDIDREKLTKLENYMGRMAQLAKDMDEARKELGGCNDMICVKKYTAVIKSFVDEKNTLAEIRRTVGLLWKDKKVIMARIAKLEVGLE